MTDSIQGPEEIKEYPIHYSVDQVKMVGGRPQIQGWVVGAAEEDGIQVLDPLGQPVPVQINRLIRLDVNQSLKLADENYASGFAITIDESFTGQYVKMIFTSRDDQRVHNVDLGTAAKPKEYDTWVREKLKSWKKPAADDASTAFGIVVYDMAHQKKCPLIQSLTAGTYRNRVILGFVDLPQLKDTEGTDYLLFAFDNFSLREDAMDALNACVKDHPDADIIYFDEDCYDAEADLYYDPAFKPDYNIDLLRSTNYIGSAFVVRKQVLIRALTSETLVGPYDLYDLILRCVDETDQILHVPEILGHLIRTEAYLEWTERNRQQIRDNQTKAAQAHLKRRNLTADVTDTDQANVKRIEYVWDSEPLISIIIPNKDHVEDLSKCIQAIEEKSEYRNYEYIIIENNSTEKETYKYYNQLEADNSKVHVVYYEGEFNYSAINNFGVRHAKGDYLLLLNNDIEMINSDCLRTMLNMCMRPDVGIVGARLFYPDDTIQHAGVIIGIGGVAGHAFVGFPGQHAGYQNRIAAASDLSAVTAACLMVKREIYEAVGGLTEEFKVAFNDVDFCLKVRKAGYLVVYNPEARLYHYESKSRGYEDTPEKIARFQGEINSFMNRWSDIVRAGDPYYNENLTLDRQDFSLK